LTNFWLAKAGEVTLQPEKYDDFPECYKTKDFEKWLPPREGGRRPNFIGSDYWPAVAKHLPFIDEWQKEEHEQAESKKSARTRELEKQGAISKTARRRDSELRTTIGQFFHFVCMTNKIAPSHFKPSEKHLFSKITVKAFGEFYGQYIGSPSSASNIMGNLCNLYNHLLVSCYRLTCFQNYD